MTRTPDYIEVEVIPGVRLRRHEAWDKVSLVVEPQACETGLELFLTSVELRALSHHAALYAMHLAEKEVA